MENINVQISLGELIDKITILQIKVMKIKEASLNNVEKELATLQKTLENLNIGIDPKIIQELKAINLDLWKIEDDIRDQERQGEFGKDFIELARSVYKKNDLRSAIKSKINTSYGSSLKEVKSYKDY